jgi:hypothetical protein
MVNNDLTILLEEKKETTSVYVNEGTPTEQLVQTTTGEILDNVFPNPLNAQQVVSIDPSSEIGETVAKAYENGEVVFGVLISDPKSNTRKNIREAGVLVLGQLFRFKLAVGQTGIETNDNISLAATGAVKNEEGKYIALHPVASQNDYEYIEVFRPYDGGVGPTGPTGPSG